MRVTQMMAMALSAACVAGPAVAGDLIYRHDRYGGPDLLEQSDGQPYWVLFSECAGFHGALANTAASEADYERELASGTAWVNRALSRLGADRGLGRAEALALVEPRVSQARAVGEAGIVGSAGGGGQALTAEQVMRSTCGSLERVFSAQAG